MELATWYLNRDVSYWNSNELVLNLKTELEEYVCCQSNTWFTDLRKNVDFCGFCDSAIKQIIDLGINETRTLVKKVTICGNGERFEAMISAGLLTK